jgi:hypothetical protein
MNHLRFSIFCSGILLLSLTLNAQNVSISDDQTATPDANAVLDVSSTSKGVLFPRLTTSQRTALGTANPKNGTLVFDSEKNTYWYWVNGGWVELAGSGAATVPVGTILTYAGAVTDDGSVIEVQPGYLLCNGAEITGLQYTALKNTLSTAWGNGGDSDPNTVNLPDLRGMFLRGANGTRADGKGDPDVASRTALQNGGSTGNNVGSYQNDEIKSHSHGDIYGGNGDFGQMNNNTGGNPQGVIGNILIPASGGSETRPKNAYVNYIIKY